MGILVRAIVTGFGFSLGKALFDRVRNQLGFENSDEDIPEPAGDVDDDEQAEEPASR